MAQRDPVRSFASLDSVSGMDPLLLSRPLTSQEDERLAHIEAVIKLIAMTVHGLELAVGERSARVLGSIMGIHLYRVWAPRIKAGSLRETLEKLNTRSFRLDVYRMRGRLVHTDPQTGRKAFYCIGRECPIRQILYHEDLPAGRTLCRVMCSFMESLLADQLGGKYRVSLVRYGPNACFIRAEILSGPEPPSDLEVYSRKPSLDEYTQLLEDDLRDILLAFDETVERVLGGNPTMSYMAGKRYGLLDGDNLLTYLGATIPLGEAIETVNTAYRGILELKLDGDTLVLEKSLYHQLAEKYNLVHAVFIYRTVQGYIAGILERLTGRRVDLRALDERGTKLRVIAR